MLKKLLSDGVKVLTGVGLFATLHGYKLTLDATKAAKSKFLDDENISNLKNKVDKLEEKAEIDQNHLEAFKARVQEVKGELQHESEILKQIDHNSSYASTDSQHHVQNVVDKAADLDKDINRLLELLNTKKFWNGQNWLDFINTVYTKCIELQSNLNVIEIGALFHILAAIFIFLCLLTIIGIVYSDILFSYLKIEQKFPKLGHFFKIRKAFQHYYLFLNFSLIILTLLVMICINIYAIV